MSLGKFMQTHRAHTDVMDLIGDLAACATEAEAIELTKKVVNMLGAQWFVYTTLLPPDFNKTLESFRFLVGCKPELCQKYNKRMWQMNDPFFEYARSSSTPIVGSKIKILTPGQAEMMRAGMEHGFRSGLIVPTHTSMDANKRMGVLYVGSELPAPVGEPLLLQKRVQVGALGTELLLWWNARLKRQAMREYSLLDEDVEFLQLSKKGKVANEIAAIFDITLTAAYRRLNLIKEKFNVDKIEHAVVKAESLGLLG